MSKATKRRICPAVGREISPAECGENRASRHVYPVDCPHNPFAPANYDSVLQIEDGVNAKSFRWLREHALNPGLLECAIGRLQGESSAETIQRANALIAWAMFFERDTAGLTCAERWERAGVAGLKNDERVTLRGRMQSRIALIEVRRVLDKERTEVVDLLAADGKPMIVVDRSLAAMAARFSALLSWIYPLPHSWRLSGAATDVREMGPFDPPPPRPRLHVTEASPEADIPETDDGLPLVDRPAPPSLPAEPFTVEQAMERLRDAMAPFDTAAAAFAELEGSGSTLMEDVEALAGDLLNDEEFARLTVFLLQAWFALVPPASRAPEVSFEALAGAWRETLQRVDDAAGGGFQEELKEMLEHCGQPALTSILMAKALEAAPRSPRPIRQKGQLAIALVLLVVVNELDRALRAAPGRMV